MPYLCWEAENQETVDALNVFQFVLPDPLKGASTN